MELANDLKDKLILISKAALNDELFGKLLDNSIAALLNDTEVHNAASVFESEPALLKNVFATILTFLAEITRNGYTRDSISSYLLDECRFSRSRTDILVTRYEENQLRLRQALSLVGKHVPHIVDAHWKIDYVLKSSNIDQPYGPLFRIQLSTEVHDEKTNIKKTDRVNFSCDAQQLQDLVYKLKDAVRHCERIASE